MTAKIEKLIEKEDGSQAKIVATACFAINGSYSIDVYVLRRESPEHEWSLTSDRPHPNWRSMPREEYIRYGRSEMLRTVSIGQILKVTQTLHEQLKSAA